MTHKEIRKALWAIENDERKAREVLLQDHNRHYNTIKKPLIEACKLLGHTRGEFHCNGLGSSWFWCSTCGSSFDHNSDE